MVVHYGKKNVKDFFFLKKKYNFCVVKVSIVVISRMKNVAFV